MTEYAILLTGDENRWANATPEERAATFARHDRFTVALGERGHTVTGGAELEHSRGAKVVRGTSGAVSVTDGPYAWGHLPLAGGPPSSWAASTSSAPTTSPVARGPSG